MKYEKFIESKTIVKYLEENYSNGLPQDMTAYLIYEGGNNFPLNKRIELLKEYTTWHCYRLQ